MDRICGAVFGKIHSVSGTGKYAIIAADEFFEAFPDECEKTNDELCTALNRLQEKGFIDMKYARGDLYCVAPLKEFVESSFVASDARPEKRKRKKTDFVFAAAFAGGALGSLLISLIFALL